MDPSPGVNLSVVAAGSVSESGTLAPSGGLVMNVYKSKTGEYLINFRDSLGSRPIVVATSNGGPRGSFAEVHSVTPLGFKVEGRDSISMV